METDDREEGMLDAQVMYVNSWASQQHYSDKSAEDDFKADYTDWCVEESWFKGAAPGCHFMHPLPVRREVTVAEHILDGARSVVTRQARNRMLVQIPVLHRMLSD